jgi:hypothetical protein
MLHMRHRRPSSDSIGLRPMRVFLLLACVGYWALLTVLLLVSDPASVVGMQRVPSFFGSDVGIHFTAFTILAVVVNAARWPKQPRWWIPALLMLYGIATESLQYFVPPRSVELMDYTENIVGVAFGSAVYWAAWKLLQMQRTKTDAPPPGASCDPARAD